MSSAKTEQKSSGRAYNWENIPSEVVRAGISRKGFKWKDMMMVMNECHPGMKLNPHSHTFEQMAYIGVGAPFIMWAMLGMKLERDLFWLFLPGWCIILNRSALNR